MVYKYTEFKPYEKPMRNRYDVTIAYREKGYAKNRTLKIQVSFEYHEEFIKRLKFIHKDFRAYDSDTKEWWFLPELLENIVRYARECDFANIIVVRADGTTSFIRRDTSQVDLFDYEKEDEP